MNGLKLVHMTLSMMLMFIDARRGGSLGFDDPFSLRLD